MTLPPWYYGSLIREVCSRAWAAWVRKTLMQVSGGRFTDGTHMADWVDSSVAAWIQNETATMNTIWGPPEQRSALAFVHIPPWVSSCFDPRINIRSIFTHGDRHVIQSVQENLNSSIDPGLDGRSWAVSRFDV